MNYQKIYENLINKANDRQLDGYTEKHHIIPRCMGGTNNPNNIAILTPEEHYVAHQLLVKIYPENRDLILAVIMMSASSTHKIRNNKLFRWIRRRHSLAQKGKPKIKKIKEPKKPVGRQRDGNSLFNLYLKEKYPHLIKGYKNMTRDEKNLYSKIRNYVIRKPAEVILSFY